MSKTVYSTATGEEQIAHESPLEKGVYHIPAGCVESKPPSFDATKKIAEYKDGSWSIKDKPDPNRDFFPENLPDVPIPDELKK